MIRGLTRQHPGRDPKPWDASLDLDAGSMLDGVAETGAALLTRFAPACSEHTAIAVTASERLRKDAGIGPPATPARDQLVATARAGSAALRIVSARIP
nr:MAG: hypothetical protein DIU78_25225 [Pseudomonadota bacterium]